MASRESIIEFVFNCRKTVEAVLHIVDQMGGEINQYNLLKVMFAADKYHINTYGRPVTACKYKKLQFGTVPVPVYEMLNKKKLENYLKELEMDELPFRLEQGEQGHRVHADRKANIDFLSETDIKALKYGIKEYGRLSFDEAKKKNHEEISWRETKQGGIIPFELMVENEQLLKELQETPFGIGV